MAYGYFKVLPRRVAFDKILRYRAFNIAKIQNIVLMVYKFFDKEAANK